MKHLEDEDTADARASADEDTAEPQAHADDDTAEPHAHADDDAAEPHASAGGDEDEPGPSDDGDEDEPGPADDGAVADRGAGETSGMEDIRMVAAAIRESEQIRLSTTIPGEDDEPLPGVAGGFGSIAGAALVRGPAQRDLLTPAASEPASKAKPLLLGAIVVLVIATGALAAALLKGGEEAAARQESAAEIAAAQLRAARQSTPVAASVEESEDSEPPEETAAADDATDSMAEASEGEPSDDGQQGGDTPVRKGGRTSDRRSTAKDPGAKEPEPASDDPKSADAEPKTEENPEPPPKKAEEYGAECILDPDLPQCRGMDKDKKKRDSGEDEGGRDDLPEKLTTNDVRAGFGAVKSKAKACGAEHGVDPGTKVRVKVSISGETGLVISAEALGEHADAPVGKCVAEALSKAKFGHFRKSVMGVTYPVTL